MSTSSSNYADTNRCETCNQFLDTVQFSGPILDPSVLNAAVTIILRRRLLEISYLSTVGCRKGTSILDLRIPSSFIGSLLPRLEYAVAIHNLEAADVETFKDV
jgi:hypothetical protein